MNWVVKPLSKVRIRIKLVGVIFVAMLLLGLSFLGVGYYQQQLTDSQRLRLNAQAEVQFELSELSIGFKIQVQEWQNLLLHGSADDSGYWAIIEKWQQQLAGQADNLEHSLEALGLTQEAVIVAEFKQTHQGLFEDYQSGKQALERGASYRAIDRSIDGLDRELTEKLKTLAQQIKQYRVASWEELQEQNRQMILIELLLLLTVMVGVLFVARALVVQALVQPLERTCEFLGQMAKGDFRSKLAIDSQDEMGQLAEYANELGQQLTKLLKAVEQSVHQLTLASDKLNQSSDLNVLHVRKQQDQTHQMASAMTQMSGAVDEVASHAHQASEKTRQANKQTDEAESILSNTIADLESLDLILNEAGDAVSRLASESQEIGSILDVIRNIADQTNLLALNAAIEAARAGEQGRGFAVVADEVRSLSLRTQEATSEIQNMISKLQAGASNAVTAMTNGQEGSRRGLEQTREAGDALIKIHNQLNYLNDLNAQLAAAALEQSHVATEINSNVQQMRQLGDEVADETQVNQDIAKQLHNNAERLERQLRQFQLN